MTLFGLKPFHSFCNETCALGADQTAARSNFPPSPQAVLVHTHYEDRDVIIEESRDLNDPMFVKYLFLITPL